MYILCIIPRIPPRIKSIAKTCLLVYVWAGAGLSWWGTVLLSWAILQNSGIVSAVVWTVGGCPARFYHFCGNTRGYRQSGDVFRDNAVGPNDGAITYGDPFQYGRPAANPNVAADDDGSRLVVLQAHGDVGSHTVTGVTDADVLADQAIVANRDVRSGLDHGSLVDAYVGAYVDAALRRGLELHVPAQAAVFAQEDLRAPHGPGGPVELGRHREAPAGERPDPRKARETYERSRTRGDETPNAASKRRYEANQGVHSCLLRGARAAAVGPVAPRSPPASSLPFHLLRRLRG